MTVEAHTEGAGAAGGAAEALVEEELVRVEYCGRVKDDPFCSNNDRAGALAAAMGDAVRPPSESEITRVVEESAFLMERQQLEPGLALKLAERRATRTRLHERSLRARRTVPVRLPDECDGRSPLAVR